MDCFSHAVGGTVLLSEALIQYPRFAAVSAVHHDKTTASVDNMLNHLDSEALSCKIQNLNVHTNSQTSTYSNPGNHKGSFCVCT